MASQNFKLLLIKTLTFFIIWIILSGKYDLVHMGLGLVASIGVAWLNTGYPGSTPRMLPWYRILLYLPWLFTRIVNSSLHLTKLILHPRLPIDPKLICYQTRLRDSAAVVLLGNSVTLTPGTITAEVNSQELVVHAMDDESASDLTSLRMERHIASVFGEDQERT